MTERISYKKPDYIKNLSRDFRKNQTEAENILWQQLRNKKLNGTKFLRQKPIFAYKEEDGRDRFYIADFYCHSKKLIIELDGNIHLKKEIKEYDKIREEILTNNEYKIVRFSNYEILNNIEGTLNKIYSLL